MVGEVDLSEVGLKDGDTLAATLHRPSLASTGSAFVAWCDGGVVTWGTLCGKVPTEARQVRHVQGTHSAFAALLSDGRVIAWGGGVVS